MKNNISVILLCTLPDTGIKSLGSKSLIPIHKKPIIQHQIDTINSICNNHEIIVSLSFDANRVHKNIKNLYQNIKIVKNIQSDNINFGGALVDAMRYAKYDNVLVINYGCMYTSNIIKQLLNNNPNNDNIVGVSSSKYLDNINISCYIEDNHITNIFFNLSNIKYCDMFYLNKSTKELILSKFSIGNSINKFTFEIINSIIESGSRFKAIFLPDKDYTFVSNPKTLNRCKRILDNATTSTKS